MTSSTVMNLDALIDEIERLSKKRPKELLIDDKSRARLRDAARNLSIAMESRNDSVFRLSYLPAQSAMARLGVDIKIFEILTASPEPLTSMEIAAQTGVDPTLMDRFLRYFASHSMIAEAGLDRYAPSNVTAALVSPDYDATMTFNFDVVDPPFMKLGQYMRENGYKDPTDPSSAPWHLGHNTLQSSFTWLNHHPEHLKNFNASMKIQRDDLPIFLDVFPFEAQLTQNIKSQDVLFVDIGGSLGQQIQALRQRYQGPGRTILQDQAEVIAQAMDVPGMETMAYDFFAPQPLKGCRAYYMRNVLHDWPDETCIQILQNTIPAMTEDSVLLIDEMVVPERGTHHRAALMDLLMMMQGAARERTMRQWEDLLNKAVLKIKKVWVYTPELQHSIIEAVPKNFAD